VYVGAGGCRRVQEVQEDARGCRKMKEGAEVQKSAEDYRSVQTEVGAAQECADGARGCRRVHEDTERPEGHKRLQTIAGGAQTGAGGLMRCRRIHEGVRELGVEWCRRLKKKVKMMRRRLTSGFHARRE
jgi:hypothetical protein